MPSKKEKVLIRSQVAEEFVGKFTNVETGNPFTVTQFSKSQHYRIERTASGESLDYWVTTGRIRNHSSQQEIPGWFQYHLGHTLSWVAENFDSLYLLLSPPGAIQESSYPFMETPIASKTEPYREAPTKKKKRSASAGMIAEYLKSELWMEKRVKKLRAVRFSCQWCGLACNTSDVFHKKTNRIPNEPLRSLFVKCQYCREKAAAEEGLDSADRELSSIHAKHTSQSTPSFIDYRSYMISSHWSEVRLHVLRFFAYRCESCGRSESLHVHHKTYERIGNERIRDLQVLCQDCHAVEHEKQHPHRCDSLSREFRSIVSEAPF